MESYPVGARVILCGLSKSPHYNFKSGIVRSSIGDTGRQEVELLVEGGGDGEPKTKNLRPSNMMYDYTVDVTSLSVKELKKIIKYIKRENSDINTKMIGAEKVDLQKFVEDNRDDKTIAELLANSTCLDDSQRSTASTSSVRSSERTSERKSLRRRKTKTKKIKVKLRIDVIEGEDLVAKDRNALGKLTSSDPYVIVNWGGVDGCTADGDPNYRIGKTQKVSKSLSPIWNCTFYSQWYPISDYQVKLKADPSLTFLIWDQDKMKDDDLMGIVPVPIPEPDEIFLKMKDAKTTDEGEKIIEDVEQWYEVPKDSCNRASGQIHIGVQILAVEEKEKGKCDDDDHSNSTNHQSEDASPVSSSSSPSSINKHPSVQEQREKKKTKDVEGFSLNSNQGNGNKNQASSYQDPLVDKIQSLTTLLANHSSEGTEFTENEISACTKLQSELKRILSPYKEKAKQRASFPVNSPRHSTTSHSPKRKDEKRKSKKAEDEEKKDGNDDTNNSERKSVSFSSSNMKDIQEDKENIKKSSSTNSSSSSVDSGSIDIGGRRSKRHNTTKYSASAAFKRLLKKSKEYIPANVRMFASCNEDDDDFAETATEHFRLPDASLRSGGVFTSSLLKLFHASLSTTMTNHEVLSKLTEELSPHKPTLTSSRPDTLNETFYIVPPTASFNGARRAVLIGISYKGQKGELDASHNDVKNIMEFLIKVEGFKDENITVLMDDDNKENLEPTRKNILNSFKHLAEISKPGDSLFCYFAGHGGQVEDDDGDEDDGYDETILPLDVMKNGPIRDDDLFKVLVAPLPRGVTLTSIFDSSHSGSVLDLPFSFDTSKENENTEADDRIAREGEFSHLVEAQNIRRAIEEKEHLKEFWESYGDDKESLVEQLTEQAATYIPANIRLFGGCCEVGGVSSRKENTTGYFEIPDASGYAGGAFTAAIIETLVNVDSDQDMTYRDALVMLRSTLSNSGFPNLEPVLASSRIDDIDHKFRIVPDDNHGTRRALMMGIGYSEEKKQGEQPKSHNDVERMIAYLKDAHDFQSENIAVVMDGTNYLKPTRKNVVGALKAFVKKLNPGDVAFCYFAGLGGGFPDDDEGETLIPLDVKQNGPVSSKLLFEKFACPVPEGVTMTCIFDCGHSGTILNLPFVFWSHDTLESLCKAKPNFFPHMAYAKSQREKERNNDDDDDDLDVNLTLSYDSDDCGPGDKDKRASQAMQNQEQKLHDIRELTQQVEEYVAADVRLFASCDEDEDLLDTGEDDDDEEFELPDAAARAGGIFTTSFLKLMSEKKVMSNREVLMHLGKELSDKNYKPSPVLSCSRPHIINKTFYVVPQNFTGTRRAVLVGIEYRGQKGELHNSHQDVHNVKEYLKQVEGFEDENITVLMDDGQHEEPTRKNIIKAYKNLVRIAKPGDAVFCYFAGHGGQQEDDDGDEDDGYDETILPVDVIKSGPIVDDYLFKILVLPLPKGVTMTCIFDSSHAGTILDLPFKFSADMDGQTLTPDFSHINVVKKYREVMKTSQGLEEFWDSFSELPAATPDMTSDNVDEVFKSLNEQSMIYAPGTVRLFAACEDSQTANELQDVGGYFEIPDAGGYPGGLFTTAMIDTLTTMHKEKKAMTNREILTMLSDEFSNRGYTQQPLVSTTRINDIDEKFRVVPDGFAGTRRAVVIGICYKKSKSPLPGCHNDATKMIDYLKEHEGFKDEDIEILMDDKVHTKPTRKNILQAYGKVVRESVPGDVVFCHFSGHGLQIEDQDGDEDDGMDEALVPSDSSKNGPIRDDMLFRKIVCPAKKGVTVTAVFDSCHSGTILDLPFTFSQKDTPMDLIKEQPNFFPHMDYAKNVREEEKNE